MIARIVEFTAVDERRRRRPHKDLPTMTRGHNADGTIQYRTEVIAAQIGPLLDPSAPAVAARLWVSIEGATAFAPLRTPGRPIAGVLEQPTAMRFGR
jgi:hypothetical protein